jgi:hypothetical protein
VPIDKFLGDEMISDAMVFNITEHASIIVKSTGKVVYRSFDPTAWEYAETDITTTVLANILADQSDRLWL